MARASEGPLTIEPTAEERLLGHLLEPNIQAAITGLEVRVLSQLRVMLRVQSILDLSILDLSILDLSILDLSILDLY
jgi:hypothetical protein